MIPLRATILLALEQECRKNLGVLRTSFSAISDDGAMACGYGASTTAIIERARRHMPENLIRESVVRKMLKEEEAAGAVLHLDNGAGMAHFWWPAGLVAKLAEERTAAQREWNADLVRLTAHLQASEHVSREAAEQMARVRIEREKGPCP